jgi:uncharacterized MnhB-related membrane protein
MAVDPLLVGILGTAAVVSAFLAVQLRNLIRAVVAFAFASVCIAAIFSLFASPYAAVLELTVGAGLVAVLFLVAIVLSGGEEEVTA